MARIDGSPSGPRQAVVSSDSGEAGSTRDAATPGGTVQVAKGDTLAKLAQQAYGDASKWTLIRDANPGAVKMRGDVPIIQIGAQLKIPEAGGGAEGWRARNTGSRRAVETPAPAETASQTKTAGPPTAGEVYGNAKKSLDQLEFQLKGVPAPLREDLFESLASGEAPPKQLEGVAKQAAQTMTDLREQVSKLPPDQQANVQKLLDADGKSWPLSNQALEALGTAVQAETKREAAAPRTSDAVERAAKDGLLEVRELGTVVRSMAEDMKAGKTPEQLQATSQAAMEKMRQLLSSTAVPPEQQPAFQQALGALQQLSAQGAGPDQVAALGRQLEQLPPMRGGGAAMLPQTQLTPGLRGAVAETIRDGSMSMNEFSSVLRALASDVQRGARDPYSAQQVYQEASALMMYLTQNAKVQPGQEQAFVGAAQEFGRITQMGAGPQDIARLADAIDRGNFGR